MTQYALVATLKNEGPYLLEWLAYYHHIGFDFFHISANDCSDHTDHMLSLLEEQGIVVFDENSHPGEDEVSDPQNRAYARAFANDQVKTAKYALVCDGDEFLNIHVGDGTLSALFEVAGEFDAMSVCWRIFGTSDNVGIEDQPLMMGFDKAALMDNRDTHKLWGVKTLFRPRQIMRLGIHRPFHRPVFRQKLQPMTWLNGSGADITDQFLDGGWCFSHDTVGRELVQMNHYMVRSSESFLMKQLRGTANSSNKDRINLKYFRTFNLNQTQDKTIQRHALAVAEIMQDWLDCIPGLADLYQASIHYHQSQIAIAKSRIASEAPKVAKELGISNDDKAA